MPRNLRKIRTVPHILLGQNICVEIMRMPSKTKDIVNLSHSKTYFHNEIGIIIHTKLLILTEFPFGKGSEFIFLIQKSMFT